MSEQDHRGILTESDRKWLNDEVVYEHRQTEADRRSQIRSRVAAALEDFSLLNQKWSSDERGKMLGGLEDPEQVAADVIEFLFVLLNERASDPEALVKGDSLDIALAFRRGLTKGIKQGKGHFGNSPNVVLIDSNTELFELPDVADFQQSLDTEHWRQANEHIRGAAMTEDDEVIDKDEAAEEYQLAVKLAIAERLYDRRCWPEVDEIKRHDQFIAASGPSLKSTEESDQ